MMSEEAMEHVSRMLNGGGEDQVVLLYLFVGVMIGAVVAYLISRFAKSMPYTVIVFLLGVVCSIFNRFTDLTVIGESLLLWVRIPPSLILFVFLPPLLFGDCMNLNPHHVNGSFVSALLLAGPGALIGMYLTAVLVLYCFPYGWNWNLCCLFGAILCATDPVAVIALLSQVNVSPQLTMLITGEALLNDGSALVLFNMYLQAFEGHPEILEPRNVIEYFAKVVFISPLLGFAMGLAAVFCLSLVNRRLDDLDKILQAAITIATAYITFFTGEYIVKVSGVITCCAAGYAISLVGSTHLVDKQAMETVWSVIEWLGNTILFLIAGLIIGDKIFDREPIDYAFIVVAYIFLMIIRPVMLAMLYPYLHNFGQKVTFKEAIFTAWAGLRGGVAIALALAFERLASEGAIGVDEVDGSRVILLVGGVATLTLIINAFSAGPLLDALELTKHNSADQDVAIYYVEKKMKEKLLNSLSGLMVSLHHIDFARLTTYVTILRDSPCPDRATSQSSTHHNFFKMEKESSVLFHEAKMATGYIERLPKFRSKDDEPELNLLMRVRFTYLEIVKQGYWAQISEGRLQHGSLAASKLLYAVDVAQDKVAVGLSDFETLEKDVDLSVTPSLLASISAYLVPRNPQAISILSGFIEAHEGAQLKIGMYFGESESSDTPEEKTVIEESAALIERAKTLLKSFPMDDVSLAQTMLAASVLLSYQEGIVGKLKEEGVLQSTDVEKIGDVIQKDMQALKSVNSMFGSIMWRINPFNRSDELWFPPKKEDQAVHHLSLVR